MASVILAQTNGGLTGVLLDLYPVATDVALVTDLAATESPAGSGFYQFTYNGTETGLHRIVLRDPLGFLASYYVELTNTGARDLAGDITPAITITSQQYDKIWTDPVVLDGKTPQEAMRYFLAALTGLSGGAGTTQEDFMGADQSTDRLRVTYDSNGNRQTVTYDPPPP